MNYECITYQIKALTVINFKKNAITYGKPYANVVI